MKKLLCMILTLLAFQGCKEEMTLQQQSSLPVTDRNNQQYSSRDIDKPASSSPNSGTGSFYYQLASWSGWTWEELSEDDVAFWLNDAGLPTSQVEVYLNTMFHSDQLTPVMLDNIGDIIMDALGLPSHNTTYDVHSIIILTPPIVGGPNDPGPECSWQPTIYSYEIAASYNQGNGSVLSNIGNQRHVIIERTDDLTYHREINFTDQDVLTALIASGLSNNQASQTLQALQAGQYSTRQFFELFLRKVVPFLPAVMQEGRLYAATLTLRYVEYKSWGVDFTTTPETAYGFNQSASGADTSDPASGLHYAYIYCAPGEGG